MPSPINLEPMVFDPKAAGPDLWAMYHAYRRIRHDETYPEDPIWPDHLSEASLKRDDPFGENKRYLIVRDGQIISSFYAGRVKPGAPGWDSNQHLLWADAGTLASQRRQGIGTLWAQMALGIMDEWDSRVLTAHSEEDDGQAFLEWLGAEQKSIGAENRLDLHEVDWDMVDRWVAEGAVKSPQSTEVFYENRVPEAIWEEYCPAISDMLNTMPFDDLDHGDIVFTPEMMRERNDHMDKVGSAHHSILTREPDGSISSITDIGYQPEQSDRVFQYFTGVRPDCRGRGLGKQIKASMLQYIRRTYPEARWVITGNANSNDPMLAINRRLGFKTYRTGKSYQIGREALEARLASLS